MFKKTLRSWLASNHTNNYMQNIQATGISTHKDLIERKKGASQYQNCNCRTQTRKLFYLVKTTCPKWAAPIPKVKMLTIYGAVNKMKNENA